MVERVRIGDENEYYEQIERPIRGWIYRYTKSNYWRVAAWVDFADLLQDGELCFLRCRRRYRDVEPRHLMALVKRTFANHVTDLANRRTGFPELPASQLVDERETSPERLYENALGSVDEIGTFVCAIKEAPRAIRAVLELALSDAGQAILAEPSYRDLDGVRETTNQRLCRLVGIDPDSMDLAGAVRNYLTQE